MTYLGICGCPRSGTTALVDLLNRDKRLFITREFNTFNNWDNAVEIRGLVDSDTRKDDVVSVNRKKAVFKRDGVPIDTLEKPVSGRQLMSHIAAHSDAQILGDKVPRWYLYNMRELAAKFPDMKFIICLRDGRGVIASQIRIWRKSGKRKDFLAPNIREAMPLWIEACRHMVDLLYDEALADRIHVVRYEDAVQDPQNTVNTIGKFLGLGDLDISGHDYKPVHLDAWKTELPHINDRLSGEFKLYLRHFKYV